jgi:signal transduction histidine kinase
MSRRYPSVVSLLLLLSAATLFAKSQVPKSNTRDAIKSYVQSAAKVIAKSGPSCDTFKSKDWMAGDYYVFVTGPDEKLVCHPNPSMVGKANADIVDANGKKVGTEILAAAKKKGGGWVDYVWPRPGQDKPVPKSSYSMRVKGPDGKWYVVGAGGYELK